MQNVATTKMSSKGQVVIPESIRKQLNLKNGSQFVVVAQDDVVIFKAIAPPAMCQFDKLIKQARSQARQSGLKKSDISSAVTRARGSR
jgi:AbrB family looped-hinge helix DNA binding protein